MTTNIDILFWKRDYYYQTFRKTMIACWEMAEIFLSQNMIYEWFGISFLFSEDRLANAVWFRAVDLLLLSHRRLVGVNLPLRKITQTYKCGKEISYKSPWLVSEQCRLSTFPIRGLSYNDKSTKPTVFFIHKRKYVSSFH